MYSILDKGGIMKKIIGIALTLVLLAFTLAYADRGFGKPVECTIGEDATFDPIGVTDSPYQYFRIYNSSGTEIGHYATTGIKRLVEFDHYFNKVVLGGNRTQTYESETRAYIDDFIVHGSQIASTYFTLLAGDPDTTPPGNQRSGSVRIKHRLYDRRSCNGKIFYHRSSL